MMTVEIKMKHDESKVVYFGTHHDMRDAKSVVISTCGHAGWLSFVKERSGDVRATNDKYIVDIMY
jgi:hypothetical protein